MAVCATFQSLSHTTHSICLFRSISCFQFHVSHCNLLRLIAADAVNYELGARMRSSNDRSYGRGGDDGGDGGDGEDSDGLDDEKLGDLRESLVENEQAIFSVVEEERDDGRMEEVVDLARSLIVVGAGRDGGGDDDDGDDDGDEDGDEDGADIGGGEVKKAAVNAAVNHATE